MIIGSRVGERNKTPGPDAYDLTNNAIQMFAQGLARDVGTHCSTANNVHPRPIGSGLNPAASDWAMTRAGNTGPERHGRVEDIAGTFGVHRWQESDFCARCKVER
jgi:NAD(P)-dependent dehydrogenase (short-subunit alcohol dehydrogenase family)